LGPCLIGDTHDDPSTLDDDVIARSTGFGDGADRALQIGLPERGLTAAHDNSLCRFRIGGVKQWLLRHVYAAASVDVKKMGSYLHPHVGMPGGGAADR
jgi:hypothetical protein